MVTLRLMMPFCGWPSWTWSFVWPVAPLALLVRSMSQVYGPEPSWLTWAIWTSTVLPLVTCVTVFAISWFSVFSPMSMLPARMVRPHSLTALSVISLVLMMFASAFFVSTVGGYVSPLFPVPLYPRFPSFSFFHHDLP